jgi:hypothetical protein
MGTNVAASETVVYVSVGFTIGTFVAVGITVGEQPPMIKRVMYRIKVICFIIYNE